MAIPWGDTLGVKDAKGKSNNFLQRDGHEGKTFHYMLANPPFGVEWKPEKDFVEAEHREKGFTWRFGAGLPRINDGSLLFLQHMISKMRKEEGSRIAIVFNGSPLFTGDAGSGESNIRRWIIENDWLDAVIALPDQMFYNTGIYTYIWIVTNKKREHRRGLVQLIDGTRHYRKMKKSLGNKRNELSKAQIDELVRLYADFRHDDRGRVEGEGSRICSKIFENRSFGFLKITVERPLRLNFQVSADRLARVPEQATFQGLVSSKKRKDETGRKAEIEAGEWAQKSIINVLSKMDGEKLYTDREEFLKVFDRSFKAAGIKLKEPVKKAILNALSEVDPTGSICYDRLGNPEPDSNLRDTEIVPLPSDIPLPLPLGYDGETGLTELLNLVRSHCENHLQAEVLPHVPDAWIDFGKTKVGYEIPLNRHFYRYQPPRPLAEIEADIKSLEGDIVAMLGEVV